MSVVKLKMTDDEFEAQVIAQERILRSRQKYVTQGLSSIVAAVLLFAAMWGLGVPEEAAARASGGFLALWWVGKAVTWSILYFTTTLLVLLTRYVREERAKEQAEFEEKERARVTARATVRT